MTLEETLAKVDEIVNDYDNESQLSLVTKTHQIMNEHIKELEAQIHNMKGDVQDVLYNHIRRTK